MRLLRQLVCYLGRFRLLIKLLLLNPWCVLGSLLGKKESFQVMYGPNDRQSGLLDDIFNLSPAKTNDNYLESGCCHETKDSDFKEISNQHSGQNQDQKLNNAPNQQHFAGSPSGSFKSWPLREFGTVQIPQKSSPSSFSVDYQSAGHKASHPHEPNDGGTTFSIGLVNDKESYSSNGEKTDSLPSTSSELSPLASSFGLEPHPESIKETQTTSMVKSIRPVVSVFPLETRSGWAADFGNSPELLIQYLESQTNGLSPLWSNLQSALRPFEFLCKFDNLGAIEQQNEDFKSVVDAIVWHQSHRPRTTSQTDRFGQLPIVYTLLHSKNPQKGYLALSPKGAKRSLSVSITGRNFNRLTKRTLFYLSNSLNKVKTPYFREKMKKEMLEWLLHAVLRRTDGLPLVGVTTKLVDELQEEDFTIAQKLLMCALTANKFEEVADSTSLSLIAIFYQEKEPELWTEYFRSELEFWKLTFAEVLKGQYGADPTFWLTPKEFENFNALKLMCPPDTNTRKRKLKPNEQKPRTMLRLEEDELGLIKIA
ncbi:hypothetical protein O181_029890 [Austropuccinia psidii MF-1]|uniref:Uncharacterized protein n=1 Tax=Austropuccinia psidii MF-1 TaxID=1389203 RepID=A0A9Q3CW36_9BASI|nr:hypothetical protein [Austropuccinia psidii MF-1]